MPLRRRIRALVLAPLLRAIAWLMGRLPWRAVQRFGRALGQLGWWISRRERERTLTHLALAFPEMAPARRQQLARATFLHQGTNLAECLAMLSMSRDRLEELIDVEGWEQVAAAQSAGRPILILSAHCGNWEFIAALANIRGLGMEVVARTLDASQLNEILLRMRSRFGTHTIERSSPGAARQLLKVLRDGRALGMLIDQDTRVAGVWVPFFGHPAYTPVGAAKIALKRQAEVFPAFIERRPNGRHALCFHPALDLPAEATEATALMTRAIEEQIRRCPEQWVWMHRRWRRQPPNQEPSPP